MRLLIISHTPHYRCGDQMVGWGATIREIDQLAELFTEVVHIAPLHADDAPPSAIGYAAANIRVHPVKPSGGTRWREKVGILGQVGAYARAIQSEIQQADFVHVRCPANISLVAVVMLVLMKHPRYRWVKFAGNWQPLAPDAWSYRLQRWMLRHNLHRGVVTINGRWIAQPRHVYSFVNPCLNEQEIVEGKTATREKHLVPPYRFLFVGRLESAKGIERIINLAARMQSAAIAFQIDLIGDGPQRLEFEKLVQEKGLQAKIRFHGWVPRTGLGEYFARAHFFLLLSSSEGWPKVLSEGMAYGAVPLASAVSSIPQILQAAGCGRTAAAEDIEAFFGYIQTYLAHPEVWENEKENAAEAALQFTYPAYLQAVKAMARNAWGIELGRQ